jgi:formate dehydrogenase maturation protein FdhE
MTGLWDHRIRRAEQLAALDSPSAPLLTFYARLLGIQREGYQRVRSESPSGTLKNDLALLLPAWQSMVRAIIDVAPASIAAQAREISRAPDDMLADILLAYWHAPSDRQFFGKVLLQPYAQYLAETDGAIRDRQFTRAENSCPVCGGAPQVSSLEPAGGSDGSARQLICATCLTGWPFRRVLCPGCGEDDERKLVYFHSPAYDHLRVEACETCRRFLIGVDRTRLGFAVPLVDELAGAPLHVWARERGYDKIELNLVGL